MHSNTVSSNSNGNERSTSSFDGIALSKPKYNILSRSPTGQSLETQSLAGTSIYSTEEVNSQTRTSSDYNFEIRRTTAVRNSALLKRGSFTAGHPSTSGHSSTNEHSYLQSREKFFQLMEKNQIMSMTSDVAITRITNDVIHELLELSLESGVNDFKTDDSKMPIRNMSPEMKVNFIKQVFDAIKKESSDTVEKTPKYFLEILKASLHQMELKNGMNPQTRAAHVLGTMARNMMKAGKLLPPLRDVLSELQVCCTRQSVSWVSEFVDLEGLSLLFQILTQIHSKSERKQKHFEIEVEILRIIRAVISQEKGIYDIFYHPKPLAEIVVCLNSPYISARTYASELLLVLTTLDYPVGHQLVMKAFQDVAKKIDGTRPFRILVETIRDTVTSRGIMGTNVGATKLFGWKDSGRIHESSLKETKEFLLSGISLIRYMIEIPIDISYRMHLRQEFTSCGINDIFKVIRTWPPDEFPRILSQVKDIEDLSQMDLDEFIASMDFILDIDMDDPHHVLDALLKSFEHSGELINSEGRQYLLSILKHLLVPAQVSDEKIRLKYFAFIDTLIAQIGMDQKGITPDFTDTYNVPVDMIVKDLRDLDDYEEMAKELRELRIKCYDWEHGNNMKIHSNQKKSNEPPIEGQAKVVKSLRTEIESIRTKFQTRLKTHEDELQKILQVVVNRPKTPPMRKHDSAYESKKDLSGVTENGDAPLSSHNSSITETLNLPALPPSPPAFGLASDTKLSGPPPPPLPEVPGIPSFPPPSGLNSAPPPPPPGVPGIPGIPPPLPPPLVKPRIQKFKPSVPLKRVQWEKTPDLLLKNTVWSNKIKLQTMASSSSLEDILEKEGILKSLETNFAAKRISQKAESFLENCSSNADSTDRIEILDQKAAQNMMIVLKRAGKNYNYHQLKDELLAMNDKVWSEELAKAVADNFPSDEVMEIINSQRNELNRMRDAEAFYCQLLEIPYIKLVLECFRFKLSFNDKFIHFASDFDTILGAFKGLHSAELFPKVLELILNIGNFLNSGSFNGNVHGFKLSTIQKLVDTKMTQGEGTLLNFIARIVGEKFSDLKGFVEELKGFAPSSKVSIPEINSELQKLKEKYTEVNNKFKDMPPHPSLKPFIDSMSDYLEKSTKLLNELHEKSREVDTLFVKVVEYYGDEYHEKMEKATYINNIKDFVVMFEQSMIQWEKEREKELLKQQRRKQAQLKRESTKMLNNSSSLPGSSSLDQLNADKKTNVVEDLLASLKEGTASHLRKSKLEDGKKERQPADRDNNELKENIPLLNLSDFIPHSRKISVGMVDDFLLKTQEIMKGLE